MSLEPWMHCRHLPTSLEFYTNILDFEIRVAPHPDPDHCMSRYAALTRDGNILHLSGGAAEEGPYGNLVYVRVTNIDDLYDRFTARGMVTTIPAPDHGAPIDQTWGCASSDAAIRMETS